MDDKILCDPRAVSRLLLDKAKTWWGVSLCLQALVFVVGVAVTLAGRGAKSAAFAVIGITIASYMCHLRSSTWQGRGDGLRRKLDLEDAYGWPVSRAEWSDILMTLTRRDRENLTSVGQELYFASGRSPGAKRALETLQESSWFSKHLACLSGHISLAVIVVLIGISITTMGFALNSLKDFDLLANIARVVTSVLMLVFSMDLLSLTLKYYDFGNQAGLIEKQANELTFPL